MKSLKFARIAAVAATLLGSGAAFAADSGTLSVSATVVGKCLFSGTTYNMNIANSGTNLDPTLSTDGTGSATVSYRCTKGYAPTFSVGGTSTSPYNATGTNGLSSGGGSPTYIPFSISWGSLTAGSGLGASVTAATVDLTGTVLNASFVNAAAGSYNASVPLAINN